MHKSNSARTTRVVSLVHSARLNGHDSYVYLKDVLERLPAQPAGRIGELMPHRWRGLPPGCITNVTRPGSAPP
jgi:hypothetical protein